MVLCLGSQQEKLRTAQGGGEWNVALAGWTDVLRSRPGLHCIGHFSSSLRWSCAAGKPDAARDVARRVEARESTFESELDSFKVDVVACLDLLVCESEKSVRDFIGQVQLWASHFC